MEPYIRILILIISFFIGAIFGSFACCQAWRIRLKEKNQKSPGKWSVCLSCGKRLTKSENIPLFSWLAQKGKCKKCGAKIGLSEILSEFCMGLIFVAFTNYFYDSFAAAITDNQITYLIMLIASALILIVAIITMWILVVYDTKWQKFPTFLLTILNISAIMSVILQAVGLILSSVELSEIGIFLLKVLGSAALLAAPYYLLSTFSKEKLVGSGDWLVALPIGLMLGHWWLALIALFVANTAGGVIGLFLRAKKGTKQIPFGPFLVFAFVIVYVMQSWLMSLIVAL